MGIAITLSDEKTREIVSSLLCSAFEGGSNYWYRIDGYVWPKGKTRKDLEAEKAKHPDKFERTFYPHFETPIMGGAVKVRDMEGDKGVVVLDWAKCERALQLMLDGKGGAHHGANLLYDINGDCLGCKTDAETGDVFLQLALWGEVIYG
jgi:hypothetical protein